MGKRTRIILYALSLVTMLAMVTLIIFSGTGSDTGSGRARRDGSSRRAERDPKRYRTGRSGHSR